MSPISSVPKWVPPFQPQESDDLFNLPFDVQLTADYFDTRSANDTRSFLVGGGKISGRAWSPPCVQGKRELQEIELYPITLGFHESRTKRGRPRPATGELAASIIDRVAKLSKGMGTNVVLQDGKGVVTVASRSSAQSR